MKIEIDYARSINKPVMKGDIKMNDTCVICDEYVPEGRQICNNCETGGIKDSGSRREFDTGAVRDIQHGKGRYDLLPLLMKFRKLKANVYK